MFDDWKDVTLSTGVVLRVRPMPPLRLRMKIGARHPDPEPPKKEIPVNIPGGRPTIINDVSDPAYLQALGEAREARFNAIHEFTWSWAVDIPDPPKGWKVESGLDKVLTRDEWRAGKDGERLDYLEYVVVRLDSDSELVARVINSTELVTEEEIKAAEDSFRGDDSG